MPEGSVVFCPLVCPSMFDVISVAQVGSFELCNNRVYATVLKYH